MSIFEFQIYHKLILKSYFMKQFYLPMALFLSALCSHGQNTDLTDFSNPLNAIQRSVQGSQKATLPNIGYIKLHLNSGKKNYSTDFYFLENSTYGLDIGYDAGMPMSKTPKFSIYSKLMEGGDYADMDFAIQALPYSAIATGVSIPISVNISEGYECSIRISDSYLNPDIMVYLEDTHNKTLTLINETSYKFNTPKALNGEGRFNLRFYSNQVTLSNASHTLNNLKVFHVKDERMIAVKGLLTENTEIVLYDLQGRLVSKSILDGASAMNRVDVSTVTSGIYVVLLKNNSHQTTQKVIIR